MTELLHPSNDFVFKRIFGSEENKDVPLDKQSIFDIWARTEAGEHINVEMQLFNKYDIEKRTLYYWGKRYSAQLQEGQTYKILKKCVTINILNYSFLPNDIYHNTFHLKEDLTAIQLIDDIEIHFIELPKLDGMALPKDSGLINWLFFLKGTDKTNCEVLQMNEPTIKKAMTTLKFLSQDSEARIRYEERQKYLHDEASAMEWARDNGLEKGLKKGLKKGQEQGERQKALEIAKNLLKEGLAMDLISKATGISEKEIMSLK